MKYSSEVDTMSDYQPIDELNVDTDYNEVIKDKKTVSYSNFHCKRCGICCKGQFTDLAINLDDLYRLSQGLNLTMNETSKRYCDIREFSGNKLKFTIKMDNCCPFFSGNDGCKVHSFKPASCKAFPFMQYNISYVGDVLCYGKIPNCAFNEMDKDAIIQYDFEWLVDLELWSAITDAYLFYNKKIHEPYIRDFYKKAKRIIADDQVREIIKDRIVTQYKLNIIHRDNRQSVKLTPDTEYFILQKFAQYLPKQR